jgi:hypothetical protein
MEGIDVLDKWLAAQEADLVTALVAAASKSTDPDVRGIAGRIHAVHGTREAITAQRKAGANDE